MSSNNSNLAQITSFLAGKGEGPAQIAGIEGNLQVESGFSPTASNSREGAIGIAQWEGGRRTALDRYAAATGGSETSLSTQLGYLWSELTGPYSSVLAAINGTNDPGVVARDWDVGPGGVNSGTGFENSSGSATQTRISDARALYSQLAAGKIPTTSSGSGAQGLTAGILPTMPGGTWNPLNWPSEVGNTVLGAAGDAASSVAGSVVGSALKVVLPFMTKLAFIGLGLGLVGLGLYRASKPAIDNAQQKAEQLAPLAAAAM